ncbi:MAG: hypothetical protein EAZ91_24260 [Cytophagales bacterium]|nr:MAG: hypothetical protein EAZ91_24260 [Cytophagales bacterium]
MNTNNTLAVIGRIIIAIKLYRRQTKDHQNLLGNERVDNYLKTYLSNNDWSVWQRVRDNQGMFSGPNNEAHG